MTVRHRREAGVLTVTLDRPDKRNAVSIAMWQELARLLDSVGPEDRVLVLTGADGCFSSGSDVSEFLEEGMDISEGIRVTHEVVAAVVAAPVPTIARVDGLAAGSALNLALACDVVVASTRSSFSEIFVRRGLSVDSGASWLLPRLVGDRRARWLALTGAVVDAATAADWGLVSEVVSPEDLDSVTRERAAVLAAVPSAASSSIRALLSATWGRSLPEALAAEAQAQLAVLANAETRSAVSSFNQSGRDGTT